MHFVATSPPSDFDNEVRNPGNAWLASNTEGRPKDYWSKCKSALADGFRSLCAYSAMYEPVGTVDHYHPVDTHRHLTYEWSNYRFASGWINSSKSTKVVLDPFKVEDGWFEIILPSLQLVLSDTIPQESRSLAEYTLTGLHLRDDERVIRQRQKWYSMYQDKKISIEVLDEMAPLIARAIRKQALSNGTQD
ncbi:MAG: hypothetical protein HGB22_07480 [Chlorobiaceae bacterium]|nr:hypothetical protein [Chlorobiaceae bacterium]